jgi:hypothetical protein
MRQGACEQRTSLARGLAWRGVAWPGRAPARAAEARRRGRRPCAARRARAPPRPRLALSRARSAPPAPGRPCGAFSLTAPLATKFPSGSATIALPSPPLPASFSRSLRALCFRAAREGSPRSCATPCALARHNAPQRSESRLPRRPRDRTESFTDPCCLLRLNASVPAGLSLVLTRPPRACRALRAPRRRGARLSTISRLVARARAPPGRR